MATTTEELLDLIRTAIDKGEPSAPVTVEETSTKNIEGKAASGFTL